MNRSTPFVPARVTRTRIQTYAAPPAVLFPLHGPAEEAKWAVGWEPEIVHPGTAPGERGAIFVTRHGGADAVWVNTVWNPPAGRIGYVHVSPERDVTEIAIVVSGPEHGPATVGVTYTWTALTPSGSDFVEAQTEERFGRMMAEWEEEMAHYLGTGRKLER